MFQQLLVEALLLGTIGGIVGLLLADLSLSTGATLLAGQLPRAEEVSIDGRVLLFALVASLVTGVLAGAMPAVRAGRADLNEALKEGGRNDSAVGIRTRRLLIVGEVALSLVLLMGAAVMVRSLLALRYTEAGFNPQSVLTMRVSLPETRSTPPRNSGFSTARSNGSGAFPAGSGVGRRLPFSVDKDRSPEGRAELLPKDQPTVAVRKITPGYLRAMQIPILRGRDIAQNDSEVMLVSQSAARLLWGDEDPVGRRVTLPLQSRTITKEVIGIVGDVKQGDLSEAAAPSVW